MASKASKDTKEKPTSGKKEAKQTRSNIKEIFHCNNEQSAYSKAAETILASCSGTVVLKKPSLTPINDQPGAKNGSQVAKLFNDHHSRLRKPSVDCKVNVAADGGIRRSSAGVCTGRTSRSLDQREPISRRDTDSTRRSFGSQVAERLISFSTAPQLTAWKTNHQRGTESSSTGSESEVEVDEEVVRQDLERILAKELNDPSEVWQENWKLSGSRKANRRNKKPPWFECTKRAYKRPDHIPPLRQEEEGCRKIRWNLDDADVW